LSFREKFLTDVLYQKFCGRVLHCVQVGLFAAIPHADTRVHTHYVPALGMRRACVLARMVQRTEALA
jgi:hypothetical protein